MATGADDFEHFAVHQRGKDERALAFGFADVVDLAQGLMRAIERMIDSLEEEGLHYFFIDELQGPQGGCG